MASQLAVAIDPHSSVPIYTQIVEHIRRAVAAGVYRPGEAIPSQRVLARDLLVNPNTVQRAYEELEREGLVLARKGLGMFVTENGTASAIDKSAATVYATFVQGIRAGRAANLPPARIRGSFDQAWENAHAGAGSDV
jgi:GntR family transcriptional regulator